MGSNDDAIREVVQGLSSALEAVSGEAADEAISAGEALITAGKALDDIGDQRVDGGLLHRLGTASKITGDALRAIDDIGCSSSTESLGAQFGLAEAMALDGQVLAEAAASIGPDPVPDQHAETAEDLCQRLDDLAFKITVAGLDLATAAGGAQPTKVTYGRAEAPCPCAEREPDHLAAPDDGVVIQESDYEAADTVVRCATDLVHDQTVLLTETIAILITLLAVFSCAAQCATCNAVITRAAAPVGPTVFNGGAGQWVATQTINWTVCCCDWCWLIWTDYWSKAKTTTISWNTGVPTTRPAGAALTGARRAVAARVAAAPAPVC